MASPLPISISPATFADIPLLAKLSHESFLADRQTQMKALGKKPYSHEDTMLECLTSWLSSERVACLKAIDDATGNPVGWCCWAFVGFPPGEVPRSDPGVKPEPPAGADAAEDKEAAEQIGTAEEPDSIERLNTMTGADMEHWSETLMPPGSKCMVVVSLVVAPAAQSRGVGSALLKWGTEVMDRFGVYAWVHSSDGAWKMYAKHGFEVVGTLDVDLDEYAPAPPPAEEGEGAVWGHYVFRTMKRLPRT